MVCVWSQFGCNYGCVCYGFLPIPAVAPVTSTQAERRAAGVARSMIRRDYFGEGGRGGDGLEEFQISFPQFFPKFPHDVSLVLMVTKCAQFGV